MISSFPGKARGGRQGGFSLIEVMAALMLLAIAMVVMLEIRNRSIGRAITAMNQSIAARHGENLLQRIRAARVPDLYDGYGGDFTEEGAPDVVYIIGLGEGSSFAGGSLPTEEEAVWREAARTEYEQDEEEEQKPELTRVFLTITFPDGNGEFQDFTLETLIPTWAVYQDFELYDELWGDDTFPSEMQ
ncbi:MAG: prepilin-type N-terminal cleavage/methylation domain-containing protein [Planctomycetota bacterium]|nr:MAG: prepilin-type N-terminal cleavage/methylation domain-containing protein [Planctomycetota bacterium]